MIVKDEELTLPRVLQTAPLFADEIIIVDSGSRDRTVQIASDAGCKVYHFDWIDDFSAARNYAFSLAKGDYLMWLDADDIITGERAQKLNELKKNLSADVVMLPYHMGEPPSLVYWRERILKRAMGLRFKGRVHEAIEVRGKVIFENIPIVHDKLKKSDPKRNLRIFEKMLEESDLSGREAFYYGSELYYNGMNDKAETWLEKFLSGGGSAPDLGQASLFLSRIRSDTNKKRETLLKGLHFVFAPELLCELGDVYLSENDFKSAKACFLTALIADERITFSSVDMHSFIPHIRLCYCYWHLKNHSKARYHNDMALKIKPDDRSALFNASLFL